MRNTIYLDNITNCITYNVYITTPHAHLKVKTILVNSITDELCILLFNEFNSYNKLWQFTNIRYYKVHQPTIMYWH